MDDQRICASSRLAMSRPLPCLLLLIGLSSGALDARATTFTVTRTDDPSPDDCLPGDCSLREATLAANANDPAVNLDPVDIPDLLG